MAHNERELRTRGSGPQGHPSNQGPAKRASGNRSGRVDSRGGNKVTQGRGSDTGNKGKR
jgi:hypothetical protein